MVDSEALSRYIPKKEAGLLPVAAPEPSGGAMPDSDKQMIIKAIFDLKQEVDNLKARLDAGERPVTPALRPAISPVPEPDEAEWQGSGEPVTGGEIGKIVDMGGSAEESESFG